MYLDATAKGSPLGRIAKLQIVRAINAATAKVEEHHRRPSSSRTIVAAPPASVVDT